MWAEYPQGTCTPSAWASLRNMDPGDRHTQVWNGLCIIWQGIPRSGYLENVLEWDWWALEGYFPLALQSSSPIGRGTAREGLGFDPLKCKVQGRGPSCFFFGTFHTTASHMLFFFKIDDFIAKGLWWEEKSPSDQWLLVLWQMLGLLNLCLLLWKSIFLTI